jgi:H/ACA ribonucleoprotein complex subunit 4
MANRPSERTVKELLDFGIVAIDKPSGPTSHEVSAYVQKILHLKKSGHSGTLDPKVTGVLPVALGRATQRRPKLADCRKRVCDPDAPP